MKLTQTIGNPGNPCWKVDIGFDSENIIIKFIEVDGIESVGVAFSPKETLIFIDAVKFMFKAQQSESED